MSPHDFARVAEVAVSLCCAIALLRSQPPQFPVSRPVAWAAGVLASFAIAAVASAEVRSAAARELALVLGLLAIAAVVSRSTLRRHEDVRVAGVAVVATALYSAIVLLMFVLAALNGLDNQPYWLFPGYTNYRLFNHVQTVALPLVAIAAVPLFALGAYSRVAAATVAIGVAFVVYVVARGTALAILAGGFFSVILFRKTAFPFVGRLLVCLAAGVFVGGLLLWGMPLLSGSSLDPSANELTSDHSRNFLWKLAVEDMERSPWFGIGPAHYAHYPNPKAAHPHNIYLQIGAEWGLPVLGLLLGLAVAALIRMAKAVRSCDEPGEAIIGVGLFTALVAVAVDGVVSGNFVMPVSQVWIAVLIGWSVGWARRQQSSSRVSHSEVARAKRTFRCVAGVVLASQLWLCWSIWPEVRDLKAHLQQAHTAVKNPRDNPRFWSHGWF
ncbi:O-antigen ligase family protein [Ideonella sp. BN130291]|uniref:O-antigen ligase family protein n=1 Tax=Ideonella sp. BN130291 TaxID=3112940 RepID=UPI002E2581D7|nr:O-antigen ligase family protein [Ideonella sp. BN130291]